MSNAEITPSPSLPRGGELAGQLTDRLAAQLAAQQAANLAEGTPDRVLRRDRLGRIGAMVRANRDAIITAIDEDFGGDFGGRAREETLLGEVFTTLSCIRHARKNLGRWMRARARSLDLAFKPARANLMPSRWAWWGSSRPGTIRYFWPWRRWWAPSPPATGSC